MYPESDFLPLSGLQHLIFCVRQCALIHVEGQWAENALTAEGRILHERADSAPPATVHGVRIVRGLPLRSLRLGLVGRADVVEFHPAGEDVGDGSAQECVPFPVEYKRGRPKFKDCDRVQLCAQALCLEEMFDARVDRGALFYGKTRRREDVTFDAILRRQTEQAAVEFHRLVDQGRTPVVYRAPKCRSCSLLDVCLPPERPRSVADYFDEALAEGSTDSLESL